MSVYALGINHTTAPLDLRGRFAFALDQIAPTLQSLRSSFGGADSRHPQVEAAIADLRARGQLTLLVGEPVAARPSADDVEVDFKLRGGARTPSAAVAAQRAPRAHARTARVQAAGA